MGFPLVAAGAVLSLIGGFSKKAKMRRAQRRAAADRRKSSSSIKFFRE